MEPFFSDKGKFTLIKRTMGLGNDGINTYDGYEEWLLKVKEQKFYLTCDFYNLDFYKKRERVVNIDLHHESTHNLSDHEKFVLTNKSGYNVRHIFACITHLVVNIIEPVRHFRYVAFVGREKWKPLHNLFIRRLGLHVKPSVMKKFLETIEYDEESDLYKLIDMDYYHCVIGDLYTNSTWRKNNNLPSLV